ncbi:uncharacterized protein LOC116656398 [Drosophila ananassae]|uniref:uncharacterized protein LOC116655314 n=1 Tax=Drosophila ananassae TaxID=7217 RepID=UPI0013A5D730|nr:uncharacterized protein LOC116655314 [Drosophila ananassae]XP_032310674.1 uncharacterized protein LOC116655892 [Drosophila ananassae]XP_032311653.1 uncharacterized protein LOC116656340 [Drosophila ananassae]XP_032311839.1 uncharacterized protein LOC116656398 [Drosophila ananassae]
MWLAGNMTIRLFDINESPQKKGGRPKLTYEAAGKRLKIKLASELAIENQNSTPLLLHAANISARKSTENEVIKKSDRTGLLAPSPITPEKAFAFFMENGFTKQQYINVKQLSKQHGCDIYPSYSKIAEEKLKCRPAGIECTENEAKVSMQNLLNHTASRILLMQKEVCEILSDVTQCTLIFSYGFDGSTGHSLYKQKLSIAESQSLDDSLFVTSIIPIKMIDQKQRVIWLNKSPQSIRFCRPLKIAYLKETTSLILEEKENLDNQIKNLDLYVHAFQSNAIFVKFDGHLTLIDGKVLNILTGTNSCQSCPMCGAKPTQLLTTSDFYSKIFVMKPHTDQYGLSSLHAWIRFFEFLLKISYRIELRKWHVKGNDKIELEARKYKVQAAFWKDMGLHVDKPRQNGSGNTNDGNTARRAFSNPKLLSSILGIDHNLIQRLHIILIAINCHYPINSEKFKLFCFETFTIYRSNYFWYPMSPTVHKILVHGYIIIEKSIVPVGSLAESASEARHKLFKADRQNHARKCSRIDNMSDVFHRAMDSSDPLLSSSWFTKTNRMPLPAEVVDLLDSPIISPGVGHKNGSTSQNSCAEDTDEENGNDDVSDTFEIELEEEVPDDIEN